MTDEERDRDGTHDEPTDGRGPRDTDVHTLVSELEDHLIATERLPVDRRANRWLGEAQAVVSDVSGGEASTSAIETRIGQARRLLSQVGDTQSPEADERVEAALELTAAIQDRLGRNE